MLNKVPQGYDSGERSKANHDNPLVQFPFSAIFSLFIPYTMNIKLDHLHIEPHDIRTMSKHQLRAEFGNLGHLAAAI